MIGSINSGIGRRNKSTDQTNQRVSRVYYHISKSNWNWERANSWKCGLLDIFFTVLRYRWDFMHHSREIAIIVTRLIVPKTPWIVSRSSSLLSNDCPHNFIWCYQTVKTPMVLDWLSGLDEDRLKEEYSQHVWAYLAVMDSGIIGLDRKVCGSRSSRCRNTIENRSQDIW
jgi:hypothetical protein